MLKRGPDGHVFVERQKSCGLMLTTACATGVSVDIMHITHTALNHPYLSLLLPSLRIHEQNAQAILFQLKLMLRNSMQLVI